MRRCDPLSISPSGTHSWPTHCELFPSSLSAASSPLVTVDRLMWLDLLIFIQRRCQLMSEKDIALCVFYRNNNEPRSMYMNHKVRDREGRVSCPVLRRYECPLCHQSGDNAHTLKYCPLASSGEALMTAAACFRTPRNRRQYTNVIAFNTRQLSKS